MVKPEIADGNLILHMEGMDTVWALRSQLTIPLQHITDVRTDEHIVHEWFHGIKFPGSNIPGVLTAGTFYKDGKRVFWDIHHPEAAVIISLAYEEYSELVIEVADPAAFVRDVRALRKV